MSTVHEAITARHCGLQLLAISCITNLAAGILDKPITGDEVVQAAKLWGGNFIRLLREIISKL
jgi:purine-nucleoside phosphorylase